MPDTRFKTHSMRSASLDLGQEDQSEAARPNGF